MRPILKLLSLREQKNANFNRCFKMNVEVFEVHRWRIKISLYSLHHLSSSISYATVTWLLQQPHALFPDPKPRWSSPDCHATPCLPNSEVFFHSLFVDLSFFSTFSTYQFELFHRTSLMTTNRNTNGGLKPIRLTSSSGKHCL